VKIKTEPEQIPNAARHNPARIKLAMQNAIGIQAPAGAGTAHLIPVTVLSMTPQDGYGTAPRFFLLKIVIPAVLDCNATNLACCWSGRLKNGLQCNGKVTRKA
jgi:hypothetical protein